MGVAAKGSRAETHRPITSLPITPGIRTISEHLPNLLQLQPSQLFNNLTPNSLIVRAACLHSVTESYVFSGLELDIDPGPQTKAACLPLETGGKSPQQTKRCNHRGSGIARRRCPVCPSAWTRSCRTGGRRVRQTESCEFTLWPISRRTRRMG